MYNVLVALFWNSGESRLILGSTETCSDNCGTNNFSLAGTRAFTPSPHPLVINALKLSFIHNLVLLSCFSPGAGETL